MNIDELRSAQSKERQKSDLQQLRESFYGDVSDYVEELEAERERVAEGTDDPFGSPEVQQLTNDIETAKDTAEAIYERRLGKIVKKASLVSAEMANPNEVNGLTTEEQALFADLVERIEANKDHMLDVIAGDAPAGPADGGLSDGTADATASSNATAEGSPDEPAEASTDASVPHPEDGLGPDGNADPESEDQRPGRSEAAAVADDEPEVDEERSRASDTPDPGNVSAADLMGGDDADEANAANSDATTIDTTAPDPEPADASASSASAPDAGATTDDSGDTQVDDTDARDADTDSQDGDDGAGERATLRVTRDVGEIFGVDEREYRLDAEDVVTLPEENADILVAQDAAERLD